MTRLTVRDYHAMRPRTQARIDKFVAAYGVDITDVFLIESKVTGALVRFDVHLYEQDEDGNRYLDTDGEVASKVVTIYTENIYEKVF